MRLRLISLVVFMATFVNSSEAQMVRTWVSATNGSDGNPCTRSSPCRNFAAAISAVDPGGEVVVLDSGGYGSVVVDQSVSLICPSGIHGAIAPTSGDAIHVTAIGATVIIRGLYLNGQGAAAGIRHEGSGTSLSVESVVISGFSGVGISATQPLSVRASLVRRSGTGIFVGETSALVTDTLMIENYDGGLLAENAVVTARNCGAIGSSGGDGFSAFEPNDVTHLTLENCFSTGNVNGFSIFGNNHTSMMATNCTATQNQAAGFRTVWNSQIFTVGPKVYLTHCTSTQNQTGLFTDSFGTFHSPGNNFVFGNVIDHNNPIVVSPED